MKYWFLTIAFGTLWLAALSQPGTPFLRIEEGMHTGIGTGIAADRAGDFLLTCSEDKTARLWDAQNGHLLNIFRVPIAEGDEGKLMACALSPDGHLAVMGGQTGNEWDDTFCVYIFNTQTGQIEHRITGLPGLALDIKFSRDGQELGMGLNNGGARVYKTANWALADTLHDFDGVVKCIAFDKDGNFAAGCFDGKIRLYNSRFEKINETHNLAGEQPSCLAFNPVDSLLAISYEDVSTLEVRGAHSLNVLFNPLIKVNTTSNYYRPWKIAFSADGSKLLAGGAFRERDKENNWKYIVRRWNNSGKGTWYDFKVTEEVVQGIQPLPDGRFGLLSSNPEIYVLSATGDVLWGHGSLKYRYNYEEKDKSSIKVDTSGGKIGFAPYGQKSLIFNVSTRQLTEGSANYQTPAASVSGTTVTILKTGKAIVNGHVIPLDPAETVNAVDVSIDGKFTVLSSPFNIYKVNSEGVIQWKQPTPANAFSVNISGNGKAIVAEFSDGTIRWYNTDFGHELLAFYSTGSQNSRTHRLWILFTPSGYYDASAGAEDFLGWHINSGSDSAPYFFGASTFREHYYRPDIIDSIFRTYNEEKAIRIANAKRKVVETAMFVIKDHLPPQVFILSPTYTDTLDNENATITYKLQTPQDVPVTRLNVFIDGRQSNWNDGQRGAILQSSGEYKVYIKLPATDCTVSLQAENQYGPGPLSTVYLKFRAKAASANVVDIKPNLCILAIGINGYNSKQLSNLKYAAADAREFTKAMQKFDEVIYNKIVTKVLVDSAATRDSILKGLTWVKSNTTNPGDIAMIFFAGHGMNDQSLFYMMPYSADVADLEGTAISADIIGRRVNAIGGNVLVFIDACHSGGVSTAAVTDNADLNGFGNKLSNPAYGAYVFTSCSTKEGALEKEEWKHGAFTKVLLEGMAGGCLRAGRTAITPGDLGNYVEEEVAELTGNQQHPKYTSPPHTKLLNIGSIK